MKKLLLSISIAGMLFTQQVLAQDVTITYWQYEYESKIEAIDELIERFEAENPSIHVVQETFPYNAYVQKVASAIPAGEGPDVLNLYYGWVLSFIDAGYLQPLPEDTISATELESEFVPLVQAARVNGELWGLPTAVRTLALFYNRDLFDEAGINGPPSTWEEFVEDAIALTEGSGARMTQAGFVPGNQRYHLWRDVLVRQFGGEPYSDDGRTVAYDSEAGHQAFNFYTDLITEHKVGEIDFFPGYGGFRDAFMAGRVGMIIDGSFAIGTLSSDATAADWAVAELPTGPTGEKVNYGSFWMNGIARGTSGAELEASAKFIEYLASEEVMEYWLEKVGELPARQSLLESPDLLEDPVIGPFVASVPYAESTVFVEENQQRQLFYDALNEVVINGADADEVLSRLAREEQALLDTYWEGN
ncbi:MAG TPA: extracellular solute-binding protein [Trueperaceae bacterium]